MKTLLKLRIEAEKAVIKFDSLLSKKRDSLNKKYPSNIYGQESTVKKLKEEIEAVEEKIRGLVREHAKIANRKILNEKKNELFDAEKRLKKSIKNNEKRTKQLNTFKQSKKYLMRHKAKENCVREMEAYRDNLLLKVSPFQELCDSLTEMNDGNDVMIHDNNQEFKAHIVSWNQWDYYSKRYGKPKTWNSYHISIGLGRLLELEKIGILNVEGVVTVDAKKLKKTKEVTAYKATWLKKQGAYSLKEINGILFVNDFTSYHYDGEDFKEGLEFFRKKATRVLKSKKKNTLLTKTDKDRFDIVVKISDSLEAGNCRAGTESFSEKIGKKEITFKELLEYYKNDEFADIKSSIRLVIAHIRKLNK